MLASNTTSYPLYLLYSIASIHFLQALPYNVSGNNNLMQQDDLSQVEANPLTSGKMFKSDMVSFSTSKSTDICVATLGNNDATVISKFMRFSSSSLTILGEPMKLLNKSQISSQFVSFCDPECEQEFDSGLVYINKHRLEELDFFLDYYTPYRCIHPHSEIQNASYVTYLRIVTLFLMGLSSLSFLLYIVIFTVTSYYRTLPGYCMLSFSINMLIIYSCFLAINIAPFRVNNRVFCGLFVYFSWAYSFWLNVIVVDVWIAIRLATVKLRRNNEKFQKYRFFYYSLYAWGMPLIITFLIVYFPIVGNKDERALREHCAFIENNNLPLYIPLIVLQILNFVFFFGSFSMIFGSSTGEDQSNHSDASNIKGNFLIYFKICCFLLALLILGVIGIITRLEILIHIYVYARVLEGPFIVWTVVKGRTKNFCRKCFCISISSGNVETTNL